MKISEFRSNLSIDTPLLVAQVKEGVTNTGSPYLSISFRDNSGEIEGKLWDVKERQSAIIKSGKVMNVRGDVITYRNALQLKVLECTEIDGEVDMQQFVFTGPYSTETLKNRINEYIKSIENQDIFRIVSDIYHTYEKEIYAAAAAVRNHHEYYGGLATHVYGMLKLADMVCVNYPYLNRDLLVAGVLLHDIGKVIELSSPPLTEYTLEGKLLGHISISQTIVKDSADKLKINSEEVILLRHMILSHHGQYEYGSPVLPSIIEAEALNFIDNFDAKMVMIEKELRNIPAEEFTARSFALDNRSFYKHNIK
ncbi:MAG: 3'-5' exoribonuclease YhaM family protein [Erysipelotrichaceae bacterium]|jgi:3'-5' exoribonuclease